MVFMSGWAAAFLTNLYDKVINKVPFLLRKFQRVYVTKLSTIWGGVVQNINSLLESRLLHTRSTSTGYAGRRPLPWLACNVARALAFYDVFESVYVSVKF